MIKSDGVLKKFMLFASSLHTSECAGTWDPKKILDSGLKTAEFYQFKFDTKDNSGTTILPTGEKQENVPLAKPAEPELEISEEKVEEFITQNGIDVDGANTLRGLPINL